MSNKSNDNILSVYPFLIVKKGLLQKFLTRNLKYDSNKKNHNEEILSSLRF